MAVIDFVNDALSVNALYPQTLAASAQGSSQDFSDGHVLTAMCVDVGAFGANSTSLTVQAEESSTGTGSWVAISGMVSTITSSQTRSTTYGLRTQRYIRANAISVLGATPSIACSVDLWSHKKIFGGSSDKGGYDRSPST